MKVSQTRDHQERENVRLLEEMSSLQIRQTATDQLQGNVVELTETKSHLTHENNNLKVNIHKLSRFCACLENLMFSG